MAKRARPYIVEASTGQHEMPAGEWLASVRAGLLCVIRDRIAKPARNVIAWLENGKLRLVHAYWIYTSWIAIERWAPARQSDYAEKLREQYGTRAYWQSVVARGYASPDDFIENAR